MMPLAHREHDWDRNISQVPAIVETPVRVADEEIRCAKDRVIARQIIEIDPRHNRERARVDAHSGSVRTRIDTAAGDAIVFVKVDCVLITSGSWNELGQV